MSTEFFRIEVARDDTTGGDWRARAAANTLRKAQMRELYNWRRTKNPGFGLTDLPSRDVAENVMQRVQAALPGIPLQIVNYTYLF